MQQLNDIKPLHPEIQQIAQGSFLRKQPPAIQGSGWVVESLEASLWAFHNADSFKAAVLKAVNLGHDAPTPQEPSAANWQGCTGASPASLNRCGRDWLEWTCWRWRWLDSPPKSIRHEFGCWETALEQLDKVGYLGLGAGNAGAPSTRDQSAPPLNLAAFGERIGRRKREYDGRGRIRQSG